MENKQSQAQLVIDEVANFFNDKRFISEGKPCWYSINNFIIELKDKYKSELLMCRDYSWEDSIDIAEHIEWKLPDGEFPDTIRVEVLRIKCDE